MDNRKSGGDGDGGGVSSSFSYCTIVPKPEVLDFELSPETEPVNPNQLGRNVASSAGSNVRSFFLGMGYSPSLVDKVIEENGEDNIDLLMDLLMDSDAECSDHQMQNPRSSNSLGSNKDASGPSEYSTFIQPKEEPDLFNVVDDDKRACLVKMNFHANEVEFAMDKLDNDAPITEIVDFILAARIAKNLDREQDDMLDGDGTKNKVTNDEQLYGTMEKTLRLLETGFSEDEISLAIEGLGSDVPVSELAEFICAHQLGETYIKKTKPSLEDSSHIAINGGSSSLGTENGPGYHPCNTIKIETEGCTQVATSRSSVRDMDEIRKGKRPKKVHIEDRSKTKLGHMGCEGSFRGEQPKQEYNYEASTFCEPTWEEEKVDPIASAFGMPTEFRSVACKVTDEMAAKPPYFFFGNVEALPPNTWKKICQFLYVTEPEFVKTGVFSALNRVEGYVHSLGDENRFRIDPEPPKTIQEAIPDSKKWWPSWDTRKQLRCINFEASSALVTKLADDSIGLLSPQQKSSILKACEQHNLVWVGPNRLAPVEPKHLEQILGYPLNHTLVGENSLTGRLDSLRYSFQTDTLGYHLSVLKSKFPGGITVLSLFSGIGGAEIALHRLGIHLKGVVSVETCETNRRILKRWWLSSGQSGQLEQIEDIQKLTTKKVESLVEKFGSFDLIICQNAVTYSSKNQGPGDLSLFHEFVRIWQRLRSITGRR